MNKTVKISEVKVNPNNPRLIKDDKFKKLVNSIKEFPEMLNIRPIVVNKDMVILGGNMRYKACLEAGIKEVPVIITDLSEEQQKEFLIKDNVSGGEWDWDMLANEWNTDELQEWGLDLPIYDLEPSYEDLIGEEKNKPATMKITFKTVEQLQEAENDIQELIDRKYNGAFYSVSAGEI
jgi:ParB-like chromosome segregation protein Spo0J